MDELIRKMRQRRLPNWDDLRERRVLGRVEVEIPRRRRRRRVRAAAAISAAAAAFLVAFVVITSDRTDRHERRLVAGVSDAAPDTFSIELPDGSRAFVHDAGQIELEQNEEGALWVRQRRGTVRYKVRPRRRRAFVVQAGPARVRVMGTIFSVTLEREHVVVTVERGKVAVEQGEQRALLGAGDEIRVSSSKSSDSAPAASQPAGAQVSRQDRGRRPARRTAPPLENLMGQVDAARRKGDLDRAARLIEQIIRSHVDDRRMAVVLFTQGRIEQARGRFRAAARAFGRCWTRFPRGSLAEDALAEQAGALRAAGSKELASAAAQRYLSRYPRGIHRQRMKEILRR